MIARELPHVDGVSHRYVDAGGLRVHVAEAGAGDPVVLLHGWPQHWYAWRRLIPALAESYRVICPDLRGHGWTDAPASGYEKKALAHDLLALLDALGLERVRLVGHDWGGFAGFLACLRAPERFERFLALNIIHPWLRPRPSRTVLPVLAYQAPLITPVLGPRVARRIASIVFRAAVHDRDAFEPGAVASFVAQWDEPERARATSAIYRSFQMRELPAMARGRYAEGRLTVPTLLLVGEHDPVIRLRLLRDYERQADDMKVEPVADCGHFPAEERPKLVLERTLELFRK